MQPPQHQHHNSNEYADNPVPAEPKAIRPISVSVTQSSQWTLVSILGKFVIAEVRLMQGLAA